MANLGDLGITYTVGVQSSKQKKFLVSKSNCFGFSFLNLILGLAVQSGSGSGFLESSDMKWKYSKSPDGTVWIPGSAHADSGLQPHPGSCPSPRHPTEPIYPPFADARRDPRGRTGPLPSSRPPSPHPECSAPTGKHRLGSQRGQTGNRADVQ